MISELMLKKRGYLWRIRHFYHHRFLIHSESGIENDEKEDDMKSVDNQSAKDEASSGKIMI